MNQEVVDIVRELTKLTKEGSIPWTKDCYRNAWHTTEAISFSVDVKMGWLFNSIQLISALYYYWGCNWGGDLTELCKAIKNYDKRLRVESTNKELAAAKEALSKIPRYK